MPEVFDLVLQLNRVPELLQILQGLILELELLKVLTLNHEELMVDCLKDSKPFMNIDAKHGCDELDEALEIAMPTRVVQIDLASNDGFD